MATAGHEEKDRSRLEKPYSRLLKQASPGNRMKVTDSGQFTWATAEADLGWTAKSSVDFAVTERIDKFVVLFLAVENKGKPRVFKSLATYLKENTSRAEMGNVARTWQARIHIKRSWSM